MRRGESQAFVRRVAAEPRVQRTALAERLRAGGEPDEIRLLGERAADDPADLVEVLLVEAAHRAGGGAHPDAGRDGRRALVEGHGVAVRGDPDLGKPVFRVLARPLGLAQVELEEMRVGTAGEHVEAARLELVGERVRVRADLRLVLAEGGCGRDPEARRLRCDHVLHRPALHAREDRAVERLRMLLAAEDQAGARAGERLVRRRADEVAVRHRVGMQAGGDEPGEVGHVAEQHCVHLVGDLTEAVGLDGSWVRRAAADDHPRPVLPGELEDLVVVDEVRLARHAVVDERVQAPGEVDLQPVGQMAAVVEPQREHGVAGLQHRGVDRHVRLRAGVRLHVRVLGAEQLLRAVDRELLDLVDDLAPAVVALSRVTLRVLVRRHARDRLEDARPGEVLRGDQLDLAALPFELAADQLGDLGIDLREPGTAQLLQGLLGDRHRRKS